MFATLKNKEIIAYTEESSIIGSIRFDSTFEKAVLKIGEKVFSLSRMNWTALVHFEGQLIYELSTNSFTGKIIIEPSNKIIKRGKGFKPSTVLLDDKKNVLLKIQNESHFLNNGKYIVEGNSRPVEDLDLLLTLYAHAWGSQMKMQTTVM